MMGIVFVASLAASTCARHGNDSVDLEINQLLYQIGKKLAIPRRRSVLDGNVLAHDVAEFFQALEERGAFRGGRVGERRYDEISDAWNLVRGALRFGRGRAHDQDGKGQERKSAAQGIFRL